MPSRLKTLAELKASTLITCEYCIDIGSALARHEGFTEAQLRALPETTGRRTGLHSSTRRKTRYASSLVHRLVRDSETVTMPGRLGEW
jgi:AhpD family alkylhydroperoxidase